MSALPVCRLSKVISAENVHSVLPRVSNVFKALIFEPVVCFGLSFEMVVTSVALVAQKLIAQYIYYVLQFDSTAVTP